MRPKSMDTTSSLPSDSAAAAFSGGASKFLANLPSRGLFSSPVVSSSPGGMRVYVCQHNTSPPEDQLIKTNQTNILIRSLMLNKQKSDSSSRDSKGTTRSDGSTKRAAERASDGRASGKRAMTATQTRPRQEGSQSHLPDKDYQNLTVERLRALLKEKGLSIRGRKEELIARLRGMNG